MAGSLGLVGFKSNADLDAEQMAEYNAKEEAAKNQVIESSIASQIRRDWEAAKNAKRDVELQMLDCMRRNKGEYSPDKLAEISQTGGSAIYMQLTATKCRALVSWIGDILLPASGEWAFGMDATPVSDIPKEIEQQLWQNIQAVLQQKAQAGEPVDPMEMLEEAKEELRRKADEAAGKAAELHTKVIQDQLEEGGWTEAMESFIEDFSIFPGAVMKGPMLRNKSMLAWGDNWQPIKVKELTMYVARTSPFDFYPSPDATTPDDAAFLFERVRYQPNDLTNMKGVDGYNDEAIDRVLQQHSVNGLHEWLFQDQERRSLEDKAHEWVSKSSIIDGLVYHGSAMGITLLQWGVLDVDPLTQYEIESILIGNDVIRLVINDDPLERRPYHIASFQSIPGSFWGKSIPQLMADIQDICNATARSLINNMAMSSGPMSEWNYDRLAPGQGTEIYPWRVIQTKSSQLTGNDAAVRFYQPASNAGELLRVYEEFEVRADEVTNVPRYMYGNEKVGGAGSTMGGLSMLMESANKGIKSAIGHIDKNVIRRVIEALWLHNMQYHPDNSIKGDCKVVARGASAMLQRERTNMMRSEFLQATGNEIDMEIIGTEGRVKILSKVADGLDIPGLLDDPDEVAERIAQRRAQQAQAQQEAQQAQQALIKEQSDAKIAEVMAKVAKLQSDTASKPLDNEKTVAEIKKLLVEVQGAMNATNHQSAGSRAPIAQAGRTQQGNSGIARPGNQRLGLQPPNSQFNGAGIQGAGPQSMLN